MKLIDFKVRKIAFLLKVKWRFSVPIQFPPSTTDPDDKIWYISLFSRVLKIQKSVFIIGIWIGWNLDRGLDRELDKGLDKDLNKDLDRD